jgi:periplasmic protein TonB
MVFSQNLYSQNKQIDEFNRIKSEVVDTNHAYFSYELDVEPQFPGGNDSLRSFIKHNNIKPKWGADYMGIVYIAFIVERDGSIQNIKVLGESEATLFTESVIEVFGKMPKWEAGRINGMKVKSRVCLPIRYRLM